MVVQVEEEKLNQRTKNQNVNMLKMYQRAGQIVPFYFCVFSHELFYLITTNHYKQQTQKTDRRQLNKPQGKKAKLLTNCM